MNRGAWWAKVHGIAKELDTTEQLDNNNKEVIKPREILRSHFSGILRKEIAFL